MVNHLGPAVIHSALSITVGIDFMGEKKTEEKRQAEKEKHNILYCKNMQPKNHHFVTHRNFLISVFITCGMKGRESEMVMATIA